MIRGRVTLVGPLPPPFGGMSVHLLRLRDGLQRRLWNVDVVAAGRMNPGRQDARAFVGNSPAAHISACMRIQSRLVHIHHRISVLTAISAAVSRARHHEVILTLHGIPQDLLRRRDGLDPFLRSALRRSNWVIAVSDHIADQLRETIPRRQVTVVPAYLPPGETDISRVSQDMARWLDKDPDLPLLSVLVYRLLPPLMGHRDIYGLGLVCALSRQLRSLGRACRIAVLLAQPPASSEESNFLDACVASLRADQGPRFQVFVGEYAPPLIARSDVFLRPTLTDGDAVSIREALGFGVSVVASDAAPRPDESIVFASNDPNAFVSAVLRAMPPKSTRRKLPDLTTSTHENLLAIESIYDAASSPS